MAKLGEGDPRWLVQDRADGTNVNNWHWSEKDCTEWCKQRLGELFRDLPLLSGSGPGSLSARTTGVESLGGEAFINIRKAKMIPSYELDIKIGWSGEARDGDGNSVSASASRGKLHLPYVADENHDEEPELKVLCDVQDAATNRLKDAILKEAKKTIIKAVHQFVSELRAGGPAASERPGAASSSGGSSGALASAAAAAGNGTAGPAKPKLSSATPEEIEQQNKAAAGTSTSGSSAAAGGAASRSDRAKTKGRSLKITEKYYSRPKDIYECFTLEGKLRAFTQSPATVDARPGGSFSWFSGSVTGVFKELVPHKRIAMDWRFSSWEDGCYSQVTIDIEEPEEGNTVVKLAQSGIPEADRFGNEDVLDVTEKGWRGQVLMRIRQVFGYGV